MQNQAYQTCNNCSEKILVQNYPSHEAYCTKNRKKCSICLLFFNADQLNDHQQNQHAIIPGTRKCKKCGSRYPRSQAARHSLLCVMRPQFCVFCGDDEIPNQQFIRHRQICKNKMKVCPKCKKDIKILEFGYHTQKCEQQKNEWKNSINLDKKNQKLENQRQNLKKGTAIIFRSKNQDNTNKLLITVNKQKSTSIQKKYNNNRVRFAQQDIPSSPLLIQNCNKHFPLNELNGNFFSKYGKLKQNMGNTTSQNHLMEGGLFNGLSSKYFTNNNNIVQNNMLLRKLSSQYSNISDRQFLSRKNSSNMNGNPLEISLIPTCLGQFQKQNQQRWNWEDIDKLLIQSIHK